MPRVEDERLIIGYDSSDDASVFKVSDDLVVVQTIDFFPPMVDDPYAFGQIAAANAISDVYAMGATPVTALNLICVPSCLSHEITREILRGGADKAMEAGLVIAGGHSIEDTEPKYGLSVMGLCHPDNIRRNDTPRVGDVLILTKPLGTGAVTTALKADLLDPESIQASIECMAKLNRVASECADGLDVSAVTDVTGFGLLGHLAEMAGQGEVTCVVESVAVPFLPGAEQMAREGILPGGAYKNRGFVGDRVAIDPDVPLDIQDLLYDPQTSGGLLLAMRESDMDRYLERMRERGDEAHVIGRIEPFRGTILAVR